jgi:branched-chain amino acid transport system ATP-binding protein
MMPALRTVGVCKSFGGIIATDNVSISIEHGARHALIGPNGAGKTTLTNLLSGTLRESSGRIELDGHDITRASAHDRVRRGLVRTFQISELFGQLTPLQTLALTIAQRAGQGSAWWRALGDTAEQRDESVAILERFHLADVMHRPAGVLAYGKRRLLEIAIAIACHPRVLLLDEPVAGVPDGERREILDTLDALPADVSILLIEHDMDLVFSFARRISVLVNGALLTEGTPSEIAGDARVRDVYLGTTLDA